MVEQLRKNRNESKGFDASYFERRRGEYDSTRFVEMSAALESHEMPLVVLVASCIYFGAACQKYKQGNKKQAVEFRHGSLFPVAIYLI